MRLFYVLLLYSFLCIKGYAVKEEVYVFDVGHGNSQLMSYKTINVLYDCGATRKPSTYALTRALPSPYFERIFEESQSSESSAQEKGRRRSFSFSSGSEVSSPDRKAKKLLQDAAPDLQYCKSYLRQVLTLRKQNPLILFLSHPDSDHINFFDHDFVDHTDSSTSIFPEEMKVFAVLAGPWLHPDVMRKKVVRNVLEYLTNRQETTLILPYYWGIKNPYNYKGLIESILPLCETFSDNPNSDFFKVFPGDVICFNEKYENILEPFSGSLRDFLKKAKKHDSKIKIKIDNPDFDHIRIHIMNPLFDRLNSQSPVISCFMSDLKATITLTGDSQLETFRSIEKDSKEEWNSWKEKVEKSTHILMIPHHGLVGGNNTWATESALFRLFEPSMVVISQGVTSFGNKRVPSNDLVERLKSYFSQYTSLGMHSPLRNRISLLYDKGNNSLKGLKGLKKSGSILSTNALGTIYVNEDGIQASFISMIEACAHNKEPMNFGLCEYLDDSMRSQFSSFRKSKISITNGCFQNYTIMDGHKEGEQVVHVLVEKKNTKDLANALIWRIDPVVLK